MVNRKKVLLKVHYNNTYKDFTQNNFAYNKNIFDILYMFFYLLL